MNRDKAAQAMDLLTTASSQVAEALDILRDELDSSAFKACAKATAEVLGIIGLDLMRPIRVEYPDLDPDA